MASEKANATINLLAAEVMDLWQEHLALYAADPKAKAELAKMLEPQRQLFADWHSMMQNGLHAGATQTSDRPKQPEPDNGTGNRPGATITPFPKSELDVDPAVESAPQSPVGPAPTAAASDDSALRLAQLAYRMAELEKRMAKLESRNAGSAKTPRSRKTH